MDGPSHAAPVRVTHWIAALCTIALLVSGAEIVISHPRFYWGEAGNVLTPALFTLPIPSSRGIVETGYDYVMPDQNGWSRSLHFQSAWILAFCGLAYLIYGLARGHIREHLLPASSQLSAKALVAEIGAHLRRPWAASQGSYNVLQRLTYLVVIFILFPLGIWTGLAMSPAFVSFVPVSASLLGGQQSARTLHFAVFAATALFLVIHVAMVAVSGFRGRMRGMIAGRMPKEDA